METYVAAWKVMAGSYVVCLKTDSFWTFTNKCGSNHIITPLHEKVSQNTVQNYRPNRTLEFLSKVFEKCLQIPTVFAPPWISHVVDILQLRISTKVLYLSSLSGICHSLYPAYDSKSFFQNSFTIHSLRSSCAFNFFKWSKSYDADVINFILETLRLHQSRFEGWQKSFWRLSTCRGSFHWWQRYRAKYFASVMLEI